MNIKLAVKNLGLGKRQQLEKTKEWLGRLRDDAAAKSEQLGNLSAQLLEARERRDRYDREAATDEGSALKCAGAELQIRKLEPQVTALEKSFQRDLETIARQVASVRDEDIFKAIQQDLHDQLSARLATALRPFFPPKILDNAVAINLPETFGYGEVLWYLRRPTPPIDSFEDARDALNAVITQLDAIVSGQTLLEIGPTQDPLPPPEKPKRVHKPMWSEEELKQLRAEGQAILQRASLGAEADGLIGQSAELRSEATSQAKGPQL